MIRDVKIYSHICGNVLPVIDDLVDAGIDCIGPLDPLGRLHREAGARKGGEPRGPDGRSQHALVLERGPGGDRGRGAHLH